MQKIETITLSNVLPRVFAGAENDAPVCNSQVWLHDLGFERGKAYMIEAESGTGKSSLCSFIYGNRRDYTGTIAFNGIDIRGLKVDDWCDVRRRHLALLPQEMRLFDELTALGNIDIKNRLTGDADRDQIMAMLAALEIDHKASSPASRLSIGQQQRVAIVRTLCQPFDFLILDEPVSHLDARCNRMVARLVSEKAQTLGAAVITTSVGNRLALDEFMPTLTVKL